MNDFWVGIVLGVIGGFVAGIGYASWVYKPLWGW